MRQSHGLEGSVGGDVDDDDDVVVVVSSYRSEGTDTRAEVLFRMVRERVLIGFG